MKILKKRDIPRLELDGGEVREYYLDDDVEVIVTHVPSGHTQPWHRHCEITEVTYVISGAIEVQSGIHRETLGPGDLVIMPPDGEFHTLCNPGEELAMTATVKLLPDARSAHDVFAGDKELKEDG